MTDDAPAHRARGGVEAWAGLAAHQLGGALALVRGAARVLEGSRERLAPDGQDALAALAAGAERAQRFVDDLVDLVRSGDEPQGDTPSTELDRALDAAADELADALRDAGTTLRRAPLPAAALERTEAERLFVHLLRTAAAAGAREIRIAGSSEGGATHVEVLDDGPIPGSASPAGSDPRGRGPLVGAGVSLLVSRNIVERRGGTLAVEQGEGGATAVRLTLPHGG
jgi:signal transduction histidine kinase